jgi:hypothetical protein
LIVDRDERASRGHEACARPEEQENIIRKSDAMSEIDSLRYVHWTRTLLNRPVLEGGDKINNNNNELWRDAYRVTSDARFGPRATVVEVDLCGRGVATGPPLRMKEASVFAFEMCKPEDEGAVRAVYGARKYVPVAKKVRPVPGTMPEEFRVVRHIPYDPMDTLPVMPEQPPEITPGLRLTQERIDGFDWDPDGFLLPEEVRLAKWIVRETEQAFAWDESEKGRFSLDWFEPVEVPVIEHVPWAVKNFPIPPAMYDMVVSYLQDKIKSGAYEASNSSYRSQWFFVLKRDGKSLRLVHNLKPLNAFVIKDTAVPPLIEPIADWFGARACYGSADLLAAFDQVPLGVKSRDLMAFQTPLGALRPTMVPMGYTNAMQVMQGHITHLMQPEIPEYTQPFVDDVPVRGPASRYEQADGEPERCAWNSGIRCFVWEHLGVMLRIFHRMRCAGGTFSGKKTVMCAPTITILGHLCTYSGREPEPERIAKIMDWPALKDPSDARSFLGTVGVLRHFLKNYGSVSRPLVELTRKSNEFKWEEEEVRAFDEIKALVKASNAVRPLDYRCGREIIVSVDSSVIGVGWIISQIGADGKRYPNRFCSITWTEVQSRYSQPKIELYGVFRALRASRGLLACTRFTLEVDASYIKGMLESPDVLPNASTTRWAAGINMFDFELRHVPADKHRGPDGLSRRRKNEERDVDDPEEEDPEDWLDRAACYSLTTEHVGRNPEDGQVWQLVETPDGTTAVMQDGLPEAGFELPSDPRSQKAEERVDHIKTWLEDGTAPEGWSEKQIKRLQKSAKTYFLAHTRLWRRGADGRHKRVPEPWTRPRLLVQAHDEMGHKGVYAVRNRLQDRFWWPMMGKDVAWFIKTCHECQVMNMNVYHPPLIVQAPPTLFRKAYIDTMMMPKSKGCKYFVHARCGLSSWPEGQALRKENAESLGRFIFEQLICRWGALLEIVTDNGPAFIKAAQWLSEKYGLHHIRISPYNSQANAPIERRHRYVREALLKTSMSTGISWPDLVATTMWGERVATQKTTKSTPYHIVTGTEPLLPFDIDQATYMLPAEGMMNDAELIARRTQMLLMREEDLAEVREQVYNARKKAAHRFADTHARRIKDFAHEPGDAVLVRDSVAEKDLGKGNARYYGPMVVVRRNARGAYVLAELDGTVSRLRYAAFRVIPYYPRQHIELNLEELEEAPEQAEEELEEEQGPESGEFEDDAESAEGSGDEY